MSAHETYLKNRVEDLNIVPLLGSEFVPAEVFSGTVLGFVYKKLVDNLVWVKIFFASR
jgi:hypothetical protein